MNKRWSVAFVVLVLVMSAWACGESGDTGGETPAPTEALAPEVTATEKPESEEPTEAPAEEPTEEPTEAPTEEPTEVPPTEVPEPEYKEPVVLLALEESGGTVTDNYDFPPCFKAVFYWTASAGAYGNASLILKLHNVSAEREISLVNEFGMDTPDGISGAVVQPLIGGEYFFSSENTDEPWTVNVVCEDGVAPVASGELTVEGFGNTVTENYELPKCTKSVFVWSVDPDDHGSAALILGLCNVEDEQCSSIVNEFEMDLSDPMEGESLERISGGIYFLATDNASGNSWRVSWECRD